MLKFLAEFSNLHLFITTPYSGFSKLFFRELLLLGALLIQITCLSNSDLSHYNSKIFASVQGMIVSLSTVDLFSPLSQ